MVQPGYPRFNSRTGGSKWFSLCTLGSKDVPVRAAAADLLVGVQSAQQAMRKGSLAQRFRRFVDRVHQLVHEFDSVMLLTNVYCLLAETSNRKISGHVSSSGIKLLGAWTAFKFKLF